jgi:tRNA(Ile)-lysidine synthase
MLRSLARELLAESARGGLKSDDAVVVGVSGGADSTALLHLLVELNQTAEWHREGGLPLRLHVAHLDHRLRGDESEQDAAFVQAAADSLSLPCTIDRRDLQAIAGPQAGSVEEVARRDRYAFFERVCLQVGARVVAVGHHADDNAETILHRVLRGTGVRGLAGIPRSRVLSADSDIRLIRPLLSFTRADLRTYLADAGIAFREDASNASNEPMRNRIRNILLPRIEAEVNPQVREALTRLGEQAQWLQEFLQETVERTFESLIVSKTDQVLVLNADALARKSRIVQAELIRQAYVSFGMGEQDLSFFHLAAALELIGDPTSGKQAQLPGGMSVEKRYHQLIFSLPSDEAREAVAEEIAVHLPGRTLLPVHRLEIECSEQEVSAEDIPRLRREANRFDEYVDREAVRGPLVVRGRRPGERFCPLGAPGSKKLADFLADAKVDPKDRDRVAVLCDQLGPIWVIGHRIDDRVKLTGLTRRVLHLRARPL